MPEPYDAVIQVEDVKVDTEGDGSFVVIAKDVLSTIRRGQDIRAVGSDIKEGEVLVAAKDKIGPVELGLLAMLGINTVQVYKLPKVGILSSGDELVDAFEKQTKLQIGQIYDANRPMLLAAARSPSEGNVEVVDLGILKDVDDGGGFLDEAIKQGCDVLVTSGGVSMGDRDYIKPALEKRGKVHVGRLMMKPGKPFTFATVDESDMLVFALPGNPVSSIVTFKLLVMPALRKLHGEDVHDHGYMRLDCTLDDDILLDKVRPEYHRAVLEEKLVAKSLGFQRSSCLTSMREAQLLLELQPGTPDKQQMLRGEKISALCIAPLTTKGKKAGIPFVVLGGELANVAQSAGGFFAPNTSIHLNSQELTEAVVSSVVMEIARTHGCIAVVAAEKGHYAAMVAALAAGLRKVPGIEEQLRTGVEINDDIARATDAGKVIIGLASAFGIREKLERIRPVLEHLMKEFVSEP